MKDEHIDLGQLEKLARRVKEQLIKTGISVPTKLSELDNDAGFQTEDDVKDLIAKVNRLERKIVDSIDEIDLTADDAENYIYMVKQTEPGETEDDSPTVYYDEYWIVDGKLDPLGNTKVDLSEYVKYSDKASDEDVEAMLDDVFGPVTTTPEEPPTGGEESGDEGDGP